MAAESQADAEGVACYAWCYRGLRCRCTGITLLVPRERFSGMPDTDKAVPHAKHFFSNEDIQVRQVVSLHPTQSAVLATAIHEQQQGEEQRQGQQRRDNSSRSSSSGGSSSSGKRTAARGTATKTAAGGTAAWTASGKTTWTKGSMQNDSSGSGKSSAMMLQHGPLIAL